jgi:hypothetical protein
MIRTRKYLILGLASFLILSAFFLFLSTAQGQNVAYRLFLPYIQKSDSDDILQAPLLILIQLKRKHPFPQSTLNHLRFICPM